ncbi:Phenylacetyl-ligase [Neofusicoccum parvum]|uniref:Phenylacetyl-ligase n=1 Tax=Neofusicoccum parvum TaxID=310453 RepID=A0ACB5SPH0_9PEZI|nr:Phenylacetyl-ligase [Neofusicoccum parvum]
MSLLLAPYNNAMRIDIGQGFNSYTQQICIDDAVVVDPERLVNVLTNDGFTMDNLRTSLIGDVNLSATEEQPKTSVKRGPSQIVTYSSRFVDKSSEITDDMNISGSLSIKYGAIGGSGRGSFINSDKFKESDLNFYISVKVINQTINIKDALKYQKLPSVNENNFTDIYGDSFLSGFLEGGEFNALVSMKVLNKERKTDIKAGAKVALSVGGAGIEAEANVKIAKQNISNNTEMTIQVSWSGGGNIKPMNEPWTIDTLRAAAAKFPELVATTPQRTYAILTKYETLRSFLALKPEKLIPIYYENATIYTNSLLDT